MTHGPNEVPSWGEPLVASSLLNQADIDRLRVYAITTVEDLVALLTSDPAALRGVLPDVDLDAVLQELRATSLVVEQQLDAAQPVNYRFGARIRRGSRSQMSLSFLRISTPWSKISLRRAGRPSRPATSYRGSAVFGASESRHLRGSRLLCGVEAARGVRADELSEQFLYWDCKTHDGDEAEGTWNRVAMSCLRENGVLTEAEVAVQPRGHRRQRGAGTPTDGLARQGRREQAHGRDRSGPKCKRRDRRGVGAGSAVAFAIPIYTTREETPVWTNSYGRIPMPLPGTQSFSSHAMCFVGYQPEPGTPGGGYFIVRNSWGTGFAPESPYGAGHAVLPRAYIDTYGLEAWTLR